MHLKAVLEPERPNSNYSTSAYLACELYDAQVRVYSTITHLYIPRIDRISFYDLICQFSSEGMAKRCLLAVFNKLYY